jgi:5'(3')-deoxyribonucleotidase
LYDFTGKSEFWADLEKFPWSDEIVKLVSQSGKDWRFLTKPMKTPACFHGKAEWMFNHYPRHWDRMHIGGGTKSYACRDLGDLLIDDAEENIFEWENSGGSVFHWKEITDDYVGDWKGRIQKLKEVIYAD